MQQKGFFKGKAFNCGMMPGLFDQIKLRKKLYINDQSRIM